MSRNKRIAYLLTYLLMNVTQNLSNSSKCPVKALLIRTKVLNSSIIFIKVNV